jgi:hypothetical protein
LLVTGSVVLGDYQPAISDLDLVALCAGPPAPEERGALAALRCPSRPDVEVLYATSDDLLRDPSTDVAPAKWRPALEAALALRADRSAALPAAPDALWRDAIDLSAWFIADAHRLVGAQRASPEGVL